MFDFIRSHQRLMQLVLLLLILPSFVFFGLEGYTRMGSNDGVVAKVGGVPITQQDFDNAQREQIARMQQMFGGAVDAKLFDTPEIKLQTLEGLVTERAIAYEAARANLFVTDETLRATIAAIPAVQENGAFSNERYSTLLAAQGMTPAIFEGRLRRDLTLRQLTGVLQETALVPRTVTERIALIVDQEREVAELQFKPADYASQVKTTPEMLQAYYDSHPQEFEIAQQLKVEYLVSNAEAVAKDVLVKPEAVAEYYEQNKKRYGSVEQRRASHILITASKDGSDAEKKKALATAEEVLAKVKAAPGDFAKLARQYSQDPGSADKGGDLDYFGPGAMVPQFDAAVFKMKEKEISGLVQSDFGYHIIQLTGIRATTVKPLAEVKGEIEAEISKQMVGKKFAESAEVFTNTVYEQADSLKPAADKLKLTIMTAEGVTRNAPADNKALYAHPKVLAALFSDDALNKKRNTEAIEIGSNILLSARVVENKPATKRAFADVRNEVSAKVIEAEARKLAKAAGAARLAALKAGTDTGTGFSASKLVSRGRAAGLAPEGLSAVFKADVAKLPAYTGIELGSSGAYVVYRIGRLNQPEKPDAAQRATLTQNLARQVGELEFSAYLESIKLRAKVQLMKPWDDLKVNSLKGAPKS